MRFDGEKLVELAVEMDEEALMASRKPLSRGGVAPRSRYSSACKWRKSAGVESSICGATTKSSPAAGPASGGSGGASGGSARGWRRMT